MTLCRECCFPICTKSWSPTVDPALMPCLCNFFTGLFQGWKWSRVAVPTSRFYTRWQLQRNVPVVCVREVDSSWCYRKTIQSPGVTSFKQVFLGNVTRAAMQIETLQSAAFAFFAFYCSSPPTLKWHQCFAGQWL